MSRLNETKTEDALEVALSLNALQRYNFISMIIDSFDNGDFQDLTDRGLWLIRMWRDND